MTGDYGNNKNNNQGNLEHNPYAWGAKMAMYDMTDCWDLPPTFDRNNNYIKSKNYMDSCRGLYRSSVAYYLHSMFKPDLDRSWLEHYDMSMAPTMSPTPTYVRGYDNVQNFRLDLCLRRKNAPNPTAAACKYLGTVSQFSDLLISFISVTLSLPFFVSRARKKRKKGEGYLQFFICDMTCVKKRKKMENKLRG
eukprot:11312500-Ditylum_brightwellii.AAC.1